MEDECVLGQGKGWSQETGVHGLSTGQGGI